MDVSVEDDNGREQEDAEKEPRNESADVRSTTSGSLLPPHELKRRYILYATTAEGFIRPASVGHGDDTKIDVDEDEESKLG